VAPAGVGVLRTRVRFATVFYVPPPPTRGSRDEKGNAANSRGYGHFARRPAFLSGRRVASLSRPIRRLLSDPFSGGPPLVRVRRSRLDVLRRTHFTNGRVAHAALARRGAPRRSRDAGSHRRARADASCRRSAPRITSTLAIAWTLVRWVKSFRTLRRNARSRRPRSLAPYGSLRAAPL
jgi:hypothetical protein